jgi:hypothetical protein
VIPPYEILLLIVVKVSNKIFASFAFQEVNELGRSTAYIRLKQQDRGNVISVVFNKKNIFFLSLVLNKQEKKVIRSSHRLRFKHNM